MEWHQPHWSGRPKGEFEPRRKLKPNGFARLAREAADNAYIVISFYVLLTLASAAFAAAMLDVNPDADIRITLDAETAAAEAELARTFPNIDQTFLAIVEAGDGMEARQRALSIASALSGQDKLYAAAFVPGTGPFYDTYGMLFLDLETIRARVDEVLQRQPLFRALAAAPDLGGLATLVTEIAKVVEQGRSPGGFESLLMAAAAAVEGEVKGVPRPVDWVALAGLKVDSTGPRWFVVASPRAGAERQAAIAAQRASGSGLGVRWLWPRRALGIPSNPLREFLVPAGLAVFLFFLSLAAGLASFRLAVAVAMPCAAAAAAAAAMAAALRHPLDQATWPFLAAAVAPALATSTVLVVSFQRARRKAISVRQSLMLAAHHHAGAISVFAAVFMVFWLAWLLRQLPSLASFAVIALVGAAVSLAAALTLVPATLAAMQSNRPPPERHWIDEALSAAPQHLGRNVADVLAMVVVAAAVFCAAFLPGVRFGERPVPATPGPLLDTPDGRGAIHLLVRQEQADGVVGVLASLPEVGAIRTIAQFMPRDAAAKTAELRRLDGSFGTLPVPRAVVSDELARNSLASLQEQLSIIAAGPSASDSLRAAAHRLRRTVELFSNPAPPSAARVDTLESALFGGLAELPRVAQGLAALRVPTVGDLDPGLLRRFVSADGTWRIEVMPKPGIGTLSFAGAVRRAFPEAAGEPVAALARNEIIHHETLLALATAFAATVVLMLAGLRGATAWLAALVPAACLVTFTAAAAAGLGLVVNSAMLGSASAAVALLLCAAMIMAQTLAEDGRGSPDHGLALRLGALPLLALAGAVAPLSLSSRPAVAELGAFMALVLLLAAILGLMLVPAFVRWLDQIRRR